MTGCGVVGVDPTPVRPGVAVEPGDAQQSQLQGGQVCPAGQAGHAQPQPPPPDPPSAGGVMWTQVPVGHGVVKQAMPSCTQAHESAASAAHDLASV